MDKSIFRFLTVILLAVILITNIPHGNVALGASEGGWKLEGVVLLDPPEAKNITTSVSDGSASKKMVDPNSGDSFEASMSWNAPGSYYKAGDIVEITISAQVDSYVWNGKNDGYIHMGINYAGAVLYAAIDSTEIGYGGRTRQAIYLEDENGNYKTQVSTDNGKIVVGSQSYTVSAAFPKGYKDGDRISLHVTSNGGLARYDYIWDTGEAPAVTTKPILTPEPSEWTPYVERRPPPKPDLTEGICKIGDLYGEVDVRQNDEDDDAYIFAWSGMELYHNDRVKTLTRSGCIISFSDMSTYIMKEDTTIVLDLANEKVSKISLLAGKVWTNLKNMVKDGSMEVEMSQAIAGARGTTFICEESGGVSTVRVFEGKVEVTSKATGKYVMVSGGEMLRTDSTGKGTLTIFDVEAELSDWDFHAQQVTAEAMEKADRKDFPIGIVIAAVLLLVAGVVAVIFMNARNKRRAAVAYAYVSSVQPGRQIRSKFCPNCGNQLSEHNKFCDKCGLRQP